MEEIFLKKFYSYSIILIWISGYFCINAVSELENITTAIDNITTREIENVTCIVDKYGIGYVGIQNKTKDNQPCIEWNKLVLDELNFDINIKNISRNYCRNINADPRGPWCFVNGLSTIRSFRFRRFCQIPLCKFKIRPASSEINLGVPILSNRNCPYGFTKQIKTRNSENITYCQVKQEYLNKLPSGHYSFQIMNPENGTICPGGFKTEKLLSLYKNYYCTRIDSSNNSIEFPKYLSPNSNELIFIAHRIGSDSFCPQMSSNKSIVIRNSTTNYSSDLILLSCYYFYKLAKKTVDRRLAILQLGRCPENWEHQEYTGIIFRFMIMNEYKIRVYVCIPNKDIYNYPDGDYCLISASSKRLSDIQCPKNFLDVDIFRRGTIRIKFCCRQSIKSGFENQNLYDYFNFSSIMIINSADKCVNSYDKNVSVKQYTINGFFFSDRFNCNNCDLFNVFNIEEFQIIIPYIIARFIVRFRVCSYEENPSGFAYVSLNNICPRDMNPGRVRYYLSKSSVTGNMFLPFCLMMNYPKNISFPDGQYCIYKIGYGCPQGFKTVKYKNELSVYKYKSGGNLMFFKIDGNCCKFGLKNITFKNATLPYVTENFEFGLPLINNSFNCIHGLETHTAIEDSKICYYYPITENNLFSTVFISSHCSNRSSKFTGSYGFTYSPNASIQYCHLYVNNRPPPGNYCVIFSKKCPSEYFDYVTYHPLMEKVICCRKPTLSEFTLFEWVDQIEMFSLLSYKNKCPVFNHYNYGKEPTKQDYNYRTLEISASHRKNLSDIGIKIKKIDRGYLVTIYICNYKLDVHNKSTTWPHGNYAFPKPLTGCPSNFKSGEYTQSMESATASFAHSDAIHLDSDYMIGGSSIKWSFCVKKDNYVREKLLLPYGRYCLMKVDDDCPLNFKEGSVKFVELTALDKLRINRTGVPPKIETTGSFITYYFCCQIGRGDVAHDPMYLPTEGGSFYLLKYGTYCQKVYGMKSTEEFICIDSEDSQQYLNFTLQASYKTVGATPVTRDFDKRCTLQINLCYYELDSPVPNPTTPITGPLISWPPGSYLFIKPVQSPCPPGFNQGSILAQTIFKVRPKFMHILMFGPTEDNEAVFSYCKRNSTNNDKSRPAENWPSGNYCLIFEKKCPSGMVSHKFRSLSYFFYLKESSKTMAGWARLCCKIENNSNSVPLPFFPGHFYSIIIQRTVNTHLCPPHQKARVVLVDLQSEIICYYERMDESIEFPVGEYLLPAPQKPMNACAPGFILVEHRHSALGGADKPSKHLKFCQKDNSGYKNGTFPTGNYCILTSNSRCPSNQFTIENMLTIPFYHFADQIHKYSRYLACCQRDDKIISNIATPKIPFRLYGSSPCSYVDGLVNVVENFEETSLIQQSGLERPPYSRAESKLRICEYDQTPNWNFEKNCNCHSNAICSLEFQDKNCQCRTGYFGDGKKICSKITNETDKCADVCDKNVSVCMKSAYSDDYSCNCKYGYAGDKFKCWPSCQTRHCNDFSKCVVNMTESSCTCLSGNVKSDDGSCHGDMISTISILPELFNLTQLNLSCLHKDARDHLFIPKLDQTLVVLIPSDAKVFSSCFEVDNYYGFHYKTGFELGNSSRFSFWTFKHVWISISKMEENVWSIEKNTIAVGRIIFNNAMIFYLNGSLGLKSHESDFEIGEKKRYTTKAVVVFVLTGISLFVLIFIMLFIINWKRHLCIPRRIFEARSASNIHFATEGDDIMMES